MNNQPRKPFLHPTANFVSLVLVLSLALISTGCGNPFKFKKVADQSVTDLHKLYNDGKFAEIYSTADSKFKQATTEKKFLEFMSAVQRKLGKVTRTENVGFNFRTFNFTTTVVSKQNTTFDQGTGTEVFTFQLDGEKAVLVGYNINSTDLILK